MGPERTKNLFRISCILSGILLFILSIFTNPLQNVSLVLVYLVVLYIFLLSGGYWLLHHRFGSAYKAERPKVFVVVTALVVLIMLRSLNAFGVIEFILLLVSAILLFFYLDRSRRV